MLEQQFYSYAECFFRIPDAEAQKRYPGILTEYRKLVERAGQHLPPLWESCYVSGTRALCDKTTLKVILEYKKAGIRWEGTQGMEPQDAAGIECLHVSFLLFLLEQFRKEEPQADNRLCAAYVVQLLEGFLERHLKVLTEGLLAALRGEYPFFYRVAEQIRESQEVLQKLLREQMAYKEKALAEQAAEAFARMDRKPLIRMYMQRHPSMASFGVRLVPAKEFQTVVKRGAGCWNNCGSSCLKEVKAVDGCIVQTRSADTYAYKGERLTTCLRGLKSAETFLSADRLRYPLLRTGKRGSGLFKRISWEEAIDWMAEKNAYIKETYGPQSRYVAYSTGVVSEVRPDKLIRRFLHLDGGFLEFYNDYSAACINYISEQMYGTSETGNSIEDLLHAKLIFVWGHNPLETGFGPQMRKMLAKAKKQGIRIVAIDPRRSDTAAYADEWIAVRPGTDGALAAAMAYVIVSEGLCDKDFLHRFCSGFDRETMPEGYETEESFEEYLLGKKDGVAKTPLWAEALTGVKAEKIAELAKAYALAKPAAILQGCGPQRHANGEQTARMIAVLACLCGYVGISGGRCGAVDAVAMYPPAKFPKGENPYRGEIPCYLWTKAVADGVHMEPVKDGLRGVTHLDSNIKMIWCLAGNTLMNQHGDMNATKRILEDESLCECIICSDLYMTASAMYADLVLPGASCFEVENLTRAWQEGDFLLYNQKYTEPLFESRYEYDWICKLAQASGCGEAFQKSEKSGRTHTSAESWCRELYEELRETQKAAGGMVPYETLQENGIALYPEREPVIAFRRQIEEGVPFDTYSGKIELFDPLLYHLYTEEEIAPIPKYAPLANGCETLVKDGRHFQLVGWHTKVRSHSCHDTNVSLQKKEPQAVWMHPEDAAEFWPGGADEEGQGLREGDLVCLSNDRGRTIVPVKLTDGIARGVLALSQGAWYRPDEEGTDRGGSINILTSLTPTPAAKGNPQHSITVAVHRIKTSGSFKQL